LTQVNKQNQEKTMPELEIALAVIDTKGGKVRATNQSDNQIIAPLTALVCQQMTRACVGKSGQQEGLYQRHLKMPQPVGGRTIKQERKLVHPTGTSISKYRRNQVFHIADSRQGMGEPDPSEIERRLFSAQRFSYTGS
jgi:hypothetical protein